MIHLDDLLVLRTGGFPQPGQAADVVVDAFDGVLMHQPNHFHLGMVHGPGDEAIDDSVIRIGEKIADGADIEVGRVAVGR